MEKLKLKLIIIDKFNVIIDHSRHFRKINFSLIK